MADMELNIINYILDKKKINQKELAGMLQPAVSRSTLSNWKRDTTTIPPKRKTELWKIARIGKFSKGQSIQWSELTDGSKKIADHWYWVIGDDFGQIGNSIWTKEPYGDINYDSVWIDNIQKMLITLNTAGLPVKDLEITFGPFRDLIYEGDGEYDLPVGQLKTRDESFLTWYIDNYLTIRDWALWHILPLNIKGMSEVQFELLNKVSEIALYHMPERDLDEVGVNFDVYRDFILKSKEETLKLISKLSAAADDDVDYFRYMKCMPHDLIDDIKNLPAFISQNKKNTKEEFDFSTPSEVERQILEGIKNNEKLLKEILEILNK